MKRTVDREKLVNDIASMTPDQFVLLLAAWKRFNDATERAKRELNNGNAAGLANIIICGAREIGMSRTQINCVLDTAKLQVRMRAQSL